MLAQSLASGINPALASSVSVLMKSPIPSVDQTHTVNKKKVTDDNKLRYRERDVFDLCSFVMSLCKNLPAFHGLDGRRAIRPVAPLG